MNIFGSGTVLTPLSTDYIGDSDLAFISTMNVSEEGIALYKENYLLSAADVRINNYSALILTDKIKGSDIFEITSRIDEPTTVITTELTIPHQNLHLAVRELTAGETSESNIPPVFTTQINSNNIFEIEISSNNRLKISHQRNLSRYYLLGKNSAFYFVDSNSTTYRNNIANTLLYGSISDTEIYLFDSDKKSITTIGGTSLSSVSSHMFIENYFEINNHNQQIVPQFNTTWVSYDTVNKNKLAVDSSRSYTDLSSNYLVSYQYSYLTGGSIPSNFITLKNQTTDQNRSHRVDVTVGVDVSAKAVDRREYNSLITGCEQEKGSYEITVPYEFYNTDYKFVADKYNIFTTPDSFYPIEVININDAQFNNAGAIGGDSPYTSDKIFSKDSAFHVQDGQYLCTWLSANPVTPGLWVDRYFHPQRSQYIDALSGITSIAYSYRDPATKDYSFYDVVSNLNLSPNHEYIYQRIGNNYANTIINALSSYLIQADLNLVNSKNATILIEGEDYIFNNNAYSIIDNFSDINHTSQATISFWLDQDNWTTPVGHQILGNLNHRGFGIVNDPFITPIIQVSDGTRLLNINTNFDILNTTYLPQDKLQTNIVTKTVTDYAFQTTTYLITSYNIKDVLRTDHLDMHQPVATMYMLTATTLSSIYHDTPTGVKVIADDSCPLLLADSSTVGNIRRLLVDNIKERVTNIPLTGIIIDPCVFNK